MRGVWDAGGCGGVLTASDRLRALLLRRPAAVLSGAQSIVSAASRRPDGSVRLMVGGLYEVRYARAWCADALCGLQVKKARDVCGSVARACVVSLNEGVWLVVAVGAPLERCQRAYCHHPLQSQLSRFSCEARARVWSILAKYRSILPRAKRFSVSCSGRGVTRPPEHVGHR